ncbi:dihydrofolate reductase [Pseudopedobacter saltans DSM 12145]|uniref:Dihydrofolate reductase n=1 Tax=Pseudopedobacter saltans (strain ATCC 51119 / DSM 12145 / JCM 21818 / CCUG 39354 / LMG 10337 / NBRC 100064 / NCIMB 13643) TaxID=762903 RepID=F0SAH7_PSESL|nr:dihydrofolate reductase [Pseudopedobacter saltans]ADY52597.1 dihydrofolate reductase [Pseudopedobacter saltans DSM 12145]
MTVSIIVAIDENKAIGKNNQLLWHLPNDLKFFKKTTSGHTIIMGRKTFDSIGKALPNRRNIVISRNKNLKIEGAEVYSSIDQALNTCKNEQEVFIIGGAEIYKQAEPITDKFYITKVHHQFDADTFFNNLNLNELNEIWREENHADERHLYDYTFLILEKRK